MDAVTLQSCDRRLFNIDMEVAESFTKISLYLNCMRARKGYVGRVTIVLDGVKGEILRKLLEWADKHKSELNKIGGEGEAEAEPSPFSAVVYRPNFEEWDIEFFSVNRTTLQEMMEVAATWGFVPFSRMAKIAVEMGNKGLMFAGIDKAVASFSWKSVTLPTYRALSESDEETWF